ncbi:peptide chain release factor 2 [Candidatus Kuenenbacteria bacterium]|nr:peptide chain release factor 2 [Candidatus Kuenenbacteria bacterium]
MQDLINKISELRDRLAKAWGLIKVDEKKQKIIELQHQMSKPGFWNDQEKAKTISREASDLEQEVEDWEKIKKDIQDLLEITQLDKDDHDVNLRKEVTVQLKKLDKKFEQLEFDLLFKGKYDRGNAIIAIHAGAGGTDAQDWAEMLLRMYLRFCEKQEWKTQIINISAGGEAGIKSVLLQVIGKNSYGYLKPEGGVHRLVRISPFDAEKMRHTSFAMLEVLPLLSEITEIEIKAEDLRIDTFKAGGHGGQGVNTTDSAVRITHLPTKIVVSCQNERSQQQNKDTAMKILAAKLEQYYETEQEEEKQKLRGEYTEAAWGNQVRSYVLHPYKMVKDHRSDFETADVEKVLDGDLIEFIEAYLRKQEG